MGINIITGFNSASREALDKRSGPYDSLVLALAALSTNSRYIGLIVLVVTTPIKDTAGNYIGGTLLRYEFIGGIADINLVLQNNVGWFTSTGIPTSQGKNGDFYLEKNTWDLYLKILGSWVLQGNISANGWLFGVNVPTILNNPASDFTFFIRTTTWDIYQKSTGSWNLVGNIKGADGVSPTIIDSLISTSITEALSANQGKLLNDGKVDKDGAKVLSDENYTTSEKSKLASIDATHYLPPLQNTVALAALAEASLTDKARVYIEDSLSDYFYDVTALSGDIAPTDQTGGTGFWKKVAIGGETSASIKTKYESNADTNAFTDALLSKINSITAIFTTTLKAAYDTASSWVSTNGTTVLAHLSLTNNPHNVTAVQIGVTNGTNGVDGASVLNGTVDPVGGDGVDGDFWINKNASTIFGPKTGGAWGTSTSLVGAQGPQGTIGNTGVAGTNGADGVQGIQGVAGNDAPNNPETVIVPIVNGTNHVINVPVTGYDNVIRADLLSNADNLTTLNLPSIGASNYHVYAYLVQTGTTNTTLKMSGSAGWVYVNNISSLINVNLTGITLFGTSAVGRRRTHEVLIYVHVVGSTTVCEIKFISNNEYTAA